MTTTYTSRRFVALLTAVLATGSILAVANAAGPSESGCTNRNLKTTDLLLKCVDADDVLVHELALQAIADANDGTRASGTPGYDQSADYVAGLLEDAGFSVERQVFQFTIFEELSSSLSVDGSPAETQSFQYSPSGSVTDGNVIVVDLSLGLGNTSTSGCDASDFDGLDFSGGDDIALLQRGECSFAVKALNAQDAGAEAVIIFNQGNTEDRTDPVGTLGEDAVGTFTIPVLDPDYATGVAIDAVPPSA